MDTRTSRMDATLLQVLRLISTILALCIQGIVTDGPNSRLPEPAALAYQDSQTILGQVYQQGFMNFDEGEEVMNDLKTEMELLEPDQRIPILNSTDQNLMSGNPRGYVSDLVHAFLLQAIRNYENDAYLSTLAADTIQNIKDEKERTLPSPQPTESDKWSSFFQNPIGAIIDQINSRMQPDPLKPYSNYNYKLDKVFSGADIGNYSDDSDNRAPTAEGHFVNGIMALLQKLNSSQMVAAMADIVGGASGMAINLLNETKLKTNLTDIYAFLEAVGQNRDEIASQFASIPDQHTKEQLMNAIEEAVKNATTIMKNLTANTINTNNTSGLNIFNKVNALLDALSSATVIAHDMVLANDSLVDAIVSTVERGKTLTLNLVDVFIDNETLRNMTEETMRVMFDTSTSVLKKVMLGPRDDITAIIATVLQGVETVTEKVLTIWPLSDRNKQFLHNATLFMNDAINHLSNETSKSEN